MNIAVVLRQVPDPVEPLEVAGCGTEIDRDAASFILNESDAHALEQAILLKEAAGATVTAVGLEMGDVENSLYTAAAQGADRIVKIALSAGAFPSPRTAAEMLAQTMSMLAPDLVLAGVQAHDELDGVLPTLLAVSMGLPYVGVIRGVKSGAEPGVMEVCKEFPGAVMAQMRVRLPAVLGILAAEQPPRYVPVSRIRAAMKSSQIEQQEVTVEPRVPSVRIRRLYPPQPGTHAEMLSGSVEQIAARISGLLAEKGLLP